MTFKFQSSTAAVISAPSVHRKHLSVQVETNNTLYVLMDETATVTSDNYTVALKQGDYWECPFAYKGRVTAIFDAPGAVARVTQLD